MFRHVGPNCKGKKKENFSIVTKLLKNQNFGDRFCQIWLCHDFMFTELELRRRTRGNGARRTTWKNNIIILVKITFIFLF